MRAEVEIKEELEDVKKEISAFDKAIQSDELVTEDWETLDIAKGWKQALEWCLETKVERP